MKKETKNHKFENSNTQKSIKNISVRWSLVIYDILCFLAVDIAMMLLYRGNEKLDFVEFALHAALSFICIIGIRFIFKIYRQIWRYGGIQSYIRLLAADTVGSFVYIVAEFALPIERISFARMVAVCSVNLLAALVMRMLYRYAYKCNKSTLYGKVLCKIVLLLTGRDIEEKLENEAQKIKIAIVGAGRVGVSLAEELLNNAMAAYTPRCFIDVKSDKIGRQIHGIPVLSDETANFETLREYEIQEIVFAMPHLDSTSKRELYDYYKKSGCKIKVYDFPVMQAAGNSKRALREFDIEELLFRKPIAMSDEKTTAYYRDKVVLITGGGGSIGSEICRQIAKMSPKRIVILDVYENGAYDVQQELRLAYAGKIDLQVEILSVCNEPALERVFKKYRPDVVLNAAAHKHVPLMEHNCCEAIENNVFGTLNTVRLSEKYKVQRFIMVSTDKAVNPTNVMGATKRMCEMIVQNYSTRENSTVWSATRFGNVLGSAGSVIPLFRKQIAKGGPITLTDKRIIRYFMTIPEASQLVIQSGPMAKNGELFVLDMDKPVKILDLAENMIRLTGYEPYKDIDIIEIGLRPGEKLYEELLIKSETLDKTENSMMFIERDTAISDEELEQKLALLLDAVRSGNDDFARDTLKQVVPTFKSPEEINATAAQAQEMKDVKEAITV